MHARAYQTEMLDLASRENSIVMLPAGAGKTLVAVELIKRQSRALTPGGTIAVFIAPTKILVRQQARVLRLHRKALPSFKCTFTLDETTSACNGYPSCRSALNPCGVYTRTRALPDSLLSKMLPQKRKPARIGSSHLLLLAQTLNTVCFEVGEVGDYTSDDGLDFWSEGEWAARLVTLGARVVSGEKRASSPELATPSMARDEAPAGPGGGAAGS